MLTQKGCGALVLLAQATLCSCGQPIWFNNGMSHIVVS